jgi:hypothetical protein
MSIALVLSVSLAHLLEAVEHRLQNAEASDFGFLAVAVIVTVWYVTRYCGD